MEDVVLKPAAVTRWVLSHVPVIADTLEMDLLVLVSLIKHVCNHFIFWWIYILCFDTWVCFCTCWI